MAGANNLQQKLSEIRGVAGQIPILSSGKPGASKGAPACCSA
jgi:hypothetical protein